VLLALKERRPQNYRVRSSFTWALSLSREMPGSNPTSGAPLYPEHPSESNSLLLLGRGAQARTSKSVAPAGKATTYPPNSANYDQFKQQGFEIARRLQDAKALQTFRRRSIPQCSDDKKFLPDPEALDTFDMEDMDEFGKHAPQDVWWQNPRTN